MEGLVHPPFHDEMDHPRAAEAEAGVHHHRFVRAEENRPLPAEASKDPRLRAATYLEDLGNHLEKKLTT